MAKLIHLFLVAIVVGALFVELSESINLSKFKKALLAKKAIKAVKAVKAVKAIKAIKAVKAVKTIKLIKKAPVIKKLAIKSVPIKAKLYKLDENPAAVHVMPAPTRIVSTLIHVMPAPVHMVPFQNHIVEPIRQMPMQVEAVKGVKSVQMSASKY